MRSLLLTFESSRLTRKVLALVRLSFPISSMTLSFPYLSRTVRSINTPLRTTLPETIFPTQWARENKELDLDLSSALQYGGSMGPIQVRSFLKEHLQRSGGVAHDSEFLRTPLFVPLH